VAQQTERTDTHPILRPVPDGPDTERQGTPPVVNGALGGEPGAAVPAEQQVPAPVSEPPPVSEEHRPAEGPPAQGGGRSNGERPGLTPPRRRGGSGRFITDHIVELGYASQEQVDKAIAEARSGGMTPEQVLLQTQAITSDQLARATSERFGLDHLDLNAFEIDLGAMNLIPSQAARRYGAIPVAFVGDETLLVAMSDPTNVRAVDDISIMTGLDVRPAVASAEDIDTAISNATKLDSSIAEAIEEDEEEQLAAGEVTEIRESAGDAPVIKLVNGVIAKGIEEGASDIHFEPEGKDMRVRYRVDGILHDATTVPRRMVAGVTSRLKIMASLDIAEKRLPQDGRVGLNVAGHPVDIRMASLPSVKGEKVVLRILDKEQALIGLDRLGMQDDTLDRFRSSFSRSYGATFVTGPTGSGKTTSLYAALNQINAPERNIITIEDPVEYQIPGLTQVQVNLKAGLTFSAGLRSMVRSDPDVIMVGEIRDKETAQIAIESALTGHLVLSTLHTNDAPTAVSRLTEMGIEPFLTASALDCVVSQRLARLLCTQCKEPVTIRADALQTFGIDHDVEAFQAKGCKRCGFSGYKGRVGLYEAMTVTKEIREMVIGRASADQIRDKAIEQGMRPLQQDGVDKFRMGITTIQEVARVTGSAMVAE
jgi:type IV pilus assembly protein PilB